MQKEQTHGARLDLGPCMQPQHWPSAWQLIPSFNGCSAQKGHINAGPKVCSPSSNPCDLQEVQEELAQVARSVNDKVTGGKS